ncbi:CPBP family intramembrane glutamic endopeptidase [Aquibacillus kalidii]|uniref:CPBP family intramembrane glutamic endopeptidase n=1 Tax=Aquibacillus kalidii TaxID=2762597 RepID=UPI0016473D24|nr:CPBP family intramembrane glutamic endopeptidase [Aquibacillus kalidii]
MFKNKNGQIRSGWLIALVLIGMLIAQVIFSIPGTIIFFFNEMSNLSSFSTDEIMTSLDQYPWLYLLAQGGGTLGAIISTYLIWRFVNKKSLKELGFRGSMADLGFGLLLGAVSITVIFGILLSTGNVELLNSFNNPNFSTYTLSFLIMFLLVGLFEEMLFRGYMMVTMLDRGNTKWMIYLIPALVFSVSHATNPNVSVIGLVNIFLVGILFAYMFDATNSLWLPIGYHVTWNYFQGNVFGFAVSGTTPHGIYNMEIQEGNQLLTGGTFGLEGGVLATILVLLGFVATNLYTRKRYKADQSTERLVG